MKIVEGVSYKFNFFLIVYDRKKKKCKCVFSRDNFTIKSNLQNYGMCLFKRHLYYKIKFTELWKVFLQETHLV